jgi:arsenate reductase (thioredoxin)
MDGVTMTNHTEFSTPASPSQEADVFPERDRHVLDRTAAHLHERYGHVADRQTVNRILLQSYRDLDRQAAVKTHIPLVAGNFAEAKLRALGIAQGSIEAPLPRVLFVDDANAGRSQMAASMLLKFSGGRIAARSAGLQPVGHLYEDALTVMAESGIDLDQAYPKPLSADIHEAAQYVVTLDCADEVDHLDGKDYRNWDVPNVQGRSLEDIRALRDDLESRVRALIREIDPTLAQQSSPQLSV